MGQSIHGIDRLIACSNDDDTETTMVSAMEDLAEVQIERDNHSLLLNGECDDFFVGEVAQSSPDDAGRIDPEPIREKRRGARSRVGIEQEANHGDDASSRTSR